MLKELLVVLAISSSSANVRSTMPVSDDLTQYFEGCVSPSDSVWSRIAASSSIQMTIDNTDCYVYYYNSIYRTPFTESSNLYLIREQVCFVPGYIANKADSYYHADCALLSGAVGITMKQYEDNEKGAKGPDFVVKDYWPKTAAFTTTVTSSYGSTVDYSLEAKLEGGAEISSGDGAGIKKGGSVSGGASVTFTASKSATTSAADPTISVQRNPNDLSNGIYWVYTVQNADVVGKTSYTMDCYLLVEMAENAINCSDNAMKFDFHLNCAIQWYGTQWYNPFVTKWYPGGSYNYDLTVLSWRA